MPVEGDSSAVAMHGGARVGVRRRFLDVTQRHATVEGGGNERVPQVGGLIFLANPARRATRRTIRPGAQAQHRRWPLPERVVTPSRASCADVVIDGDPLVSRMHSTLEDVAGVWTIDDNGLSRNGTFVNGRRVSGRVHRHDRDQIRLGGTVLTFCAPAEEDGVHTLIGEPLPAAARLTPPQRGARRVVPAV
jgi:pSer/pThr/pTyr-binding forkhead associated (FHA) protein